MKFTEVYDVLQEAEKEKVKGKSIFTMDDVNSIIKKDFNAAKDYVMKKANEAKEHIKPEAFKKIVNMVNVARNAENLAFRISNFILAHPENKLKAIDVSGKWAK